MIFLDIAILFILIVLGMNFFQNCKRIEAFEDAPPEKKLPVISVLIPARNEENTIGECLSSLLKSNYPHFEIIVLDDNSKDKTYAIVREYAKRCSNLRIIKGKHLPAGWNGKNWACHQLSQSANGEWFLFTDADTTHRPNSISAAFEAAKKSRSDFLTAIPGLITKTWAEKLILPVIHFAFFILLPSNIINFNGNSRIALGIGPFLFIRRACYFACGGFEAIKKEILDDMALAKQVSQLKGKLCVIDGTELLTVRFYTCFREVWTGLSKNSFQAIGSSPHFLLGLSLVCYFLFVYPYFGLGSAIYYGQSITFPLLQVIAISLIKLAMASRFKTSLLYSLFHPLMISMIFIILFNSFRLTLFGRKIEWKERLYPIE